jgi:hydroxymethylbilane synthase
MAKDIIKIGTRGSQLALYQANKVKFEINRLFPAVHTDIKVIQTKGDKILDVALSKIGDKGLFTKEIEIALLDGSIDIAVHSLKDLSTELPEGLKLGAVLERGEFRDALVHKKNKKLHELSENDVIATSSLRRRAGLAKYNPEIKIIDIRGNVSTRLQKMEEGHCDGMIMAAAGLQRLGLDDNITQILDEDELLPAVGQGAIAIENRVGDIEIDFFLNQINHRQTYIAVSAERAYMRTLQGGCQVPVGVYTSIEENKIILKGFIASVDGKKYLSNTIEGSTNDPEKAGENLAVKLIDAGGKEILDEIRNVS